jgi:acyl carrier protein
MASEAGAAPEVAAVEARVLAYVRDELIGPDGHVDRETNLLSGEVLDSMSVLRLAAFVGDEFAILIQPSDFVVEHFRNVAAIAEYVRHRLDRQAVKDPGA